MLDNVVRFGRAAEALIGAVYRQLGECFDAGSAEREILDQLVEEERTHAAVMGDLLAQVPRDHAGYDYPLVLSGQADFIEACADVLLDPPVDPKTARAALKLFQQLEDNLSENLFLHLAMFVDGEQRARVRTLAETSADHAARLAKITDEQTDNNC
jgi:rubrerythrin